MLEEGYNSALMLLAVGMITVGTILCLVIVAGNFLITFINRFFPEEPKVVTALSQETTSNTSDISPSKMAAIVGAVDILTQGKGKVTKIEKKK